jgi:hypothetical protein
MFIAFVAPRTRAVAPAAIGRGVRAAKYNRVLLIVSHKRRVYRCPLIFRRRSHNMLAQHRVNPRIARRNGLDFRAAVAHRG